MDVADLPLDGIEVGRCALSFFCIFAESLDLIRAFIRVFQLVGESEASQTF